MTRLHLSPARFARQAEQPPPVRAARSECGAATLPGRRPLRIYVDHGEAYGNLGDEAMLLNALRRLTDYLGPCEFILPGVAGEPLPAALPPVTLCASPYSVLADEVQRLRRAVRPLRRLPLAGRRITSDYALWLLVTRWADWRLSGWPIRRMAPADQPLRRLAHTLAQCDVFYAVGAADLSDYWPAGVVYKDWLYRLARRLTPLVVISSQGVGPLHDPCVRRRAIRALRQGHLVSFRDYDQGRRLYEQHEQHGPSPCAAHAVVGDEAFSLPAAPPAAARRWLAEAGLAHDEPFLAVHFRETDYTRNTRRLVPRLAGLLDALSTGAACRLVFIPMSYAAHSRIDRELGLALRAQMRQPGRLLVPPECRDVRLLKAAVGLARYSLGLSYHVHVFSLSQGHPALILYTGGYYRAKSDGLIGFYGAPSAALDLDEVTDWEIAEAQRRIEQNYARTCRHVAEVNQTFQLQNDWTLRELVRRVASRRSR